MSKNSYIFGYTVSSPENLAGEPLTHRIRAMNEKEAWVRFRRWSQGFNITTSGIKTSNDPEWLTRHGRIVL